MKRNLLSISDLDGREIAQLIERSMLKKQVRREDALSGMTLALIFEKPSLRTKVSFDLAMYQMGGHAVYLSPDEVGLGRRESVSDVSRVLGRYFDGIAARTFHHETLLTLAAHSSAPVINALSDLEHPCQALSDLLTIYEKKGKLSGLTVAFVGDGNNVANSLFLAAMLTGVNFNIASPPGYEINQGILKSGQEFAASSGSRIKLTDAPDEAVKGADVVYTDVWVSMGYEEEAAQRRQVFSAYRVDEELLDLAKADVLFMHPLPAHQGEEISNNLLEDPRSVVFDQAENRLHLQKSLLAMMLLQ